MEGAGLNVFQPDGSSLGQDIRKVEFFFWHLIPCSCGGSCLLRPRNERRIVQYLSYSIGLIWSEPHAVADAVIHQIVCLPFFSLIVGAFGKLFHRECRIWLDLFGFCHVADEPFVIRYSVVARCILAIV